MDINVAQGGMGQGQWDVKFVGGKLVVEATGLDISLTVGGKAILEALKKEIPSPVAASVISVLEGVLGV